jgi:hypothetical protein
MRKIIIAAALILCTGVLASQTNLKQSSQQIQVIITPNTLNNNKELASAD